MTILPCSCWPLAEHAIFGQNGFDASLGSVFVCINDSMPMDAYFFKPLCSFHRLVESYHVFLRKEYHEKLSTTPFTGVHLPLSGLFFRWVQLPRPTEGA